MKNYILSALVASAALVSCSTVSSVLQNTLPFNSNFIVTSGTPSKTQLSTVGAGTGINQIMGVSQKVKDIRANNATLTVTSGAQGMGVFQSVSVYLTYGNKEVLVATRDQISDNIGNTLSLDLSNRTLDDIMKSGNTIQQKIVYTLKSSPTQDMQLKSSITFSSVPLTQ